MTRYLAYETKIRLSTASGIKWLDNPTSAAYTADKRDKDKL